MKIDAIELFHLALPLKRPLATKAGASDVLETVLVRMQGEGAVGWGEASPGTAPAAGAEWAAGVFACVRDWLAPNILGATIDTGEQLQEALSPYDGNRFAKSALDTAWWDLNARLREQPLHKLIDGRRDTIEVGVAFDRMDSFEEFLEAIGKAVENGYARIELKFRPGWDIQMLNAVRAEFPTQEFHIDCEAAMRLDHMDTIQRLDDFGLAMVEQPLAADDLVGHAMVQESINTPVCLDESITTLEQADMALELHSCQFINVKHGRVGGLTPAIEIHNLAHDQCTPCWIGAMPQTAIGARIGLALAAMDNFTYPADLFPANDVLEQDIATSPLATQDESDGKQKVVLWSEPGIGIEPDPELLEKYCKDRAELARSPATGMNA